MSVEHNGDQSQEIVVGARGSEMDRLMRVEEIEALKLKMREDKDLKRNLAVFLSMEAHILRGFDDNEKKDKFDAGVLDAQLAVHNYQAIEQVLDYDGLWPEYISPPEFFDETISRMEELGIEGKHPDFNKEDIERNLDVFMWVDK